MYLVVEACTWLNAWFEKPGEISISIKDFDTAKISFTYGDSMPTFSPRVDDGKEYRKKGKKKLSDDMEFESILYVPVKARVRAHKQNGENYPHKTRFCYETFSNKAGWENAPVN